MSPRRVRERRDSDRFPRVSGDEPGYDDWTITGTSFSPRERG